MGAVNCTVGGGSNLMFPLCLASCRHAQDHAHAFCRKPESGPTRVGSFPDAANRESAPDAADGSYVRGDDGKWRKACADDEAAGKAK
jgi:hypothetical protein